MTMASITQLSPPVPRLDADLAGSVIALAGKDPCVFTAIRVVCENIAAVDQAAALLGVTARWAGPHGGVYTAEARRGGNVIAAVFFGPRPVVTLNSPVAAA